MKPRTVKIRTLKDGQTVTLHDNDGIRKRCGCPRRKWSSCPHPWAFSFKWKETHHRFPLDKYADHPIRSRDDALAERDRLRILIRNGQPLAATTTPAPAATAADLTFDAFMTLWRERARADLDAEAKQNEAARVRKLGAVLVAPDERLANRSITRITEDDIELAFRTFTVSGSTWNKYRDLVLKSQRWGLKKGYLSREWLSPDNEQVAHRKPGKRTVRLVPDVVDDTGKVKEPGTERRLLAKAGAWLQRLIIAALETGARRGELLSLTWADVSLTRNELTVRAENSKTREARVLPISTRLRAVLAMIDKDPAGNPHKPTAYVFGSSVGKQVKDPKKAWLKCCADAGLTGLHFHDLRHEAASRFVERGWPIHHVSTMLGHADLKTTSRYVNVTLKGLHESMQKLGTGHAAMQPLHPLAHPASEEPGFPGNDPHAVGDKVVVN